MEQNMTTRVVELRNVLTEMAAQLSVNEQTRFAKHLRISAAQLAVAAEDLRWHHVLEFLTEIENIMLACKLGVNLLFSNTAFKHVQLVKYDVSLLVPQKQFAR